MDGEVPTVLGMPRGLEVDGNTRSVDRAIAALARMQHGVVARRQLLASGVSSHAIDNRVKAGWFHPFHRGVYRVGPVAAPNAREMGAVLACGEGAVLSHRSAARLWQLLPHPAHDPAVEVTVTARDRRRPGVRVHRVRSLERDETTELKGIPITTPARTLLDLGAEATPGELERAAAQARTRRLTSSHKLVGLLDRYPRRPGRGASGP